jgi:predicted transcriptional regulator of viral defense system
VWRERTPILVSDRERTLVDCLDDPSLGGGLQHTVDALRAYADRGDVAWERLIEYGDRFGNKTVFKRLGYLAETLTLADERTIEACRARLSAGTGRLDPARAVSGPTSTRWGLRLNARIDRLRPGRSAPIASTVFRARV